MYQKIIMISEHNREVSKTEKLYVTYPSPICPKVWNFYKWNHFTNMTQFLIEQLRSLFEDNPTFRLNVTTATFTGLTHLSISKVGVKFDFGIRLTFSRFVDFSKCCWQMTQFRARQRVSVTVFNEKTHNDWSRDRIVTESTLRMHFHVTIPFRTRRVEQTFRKWHVGAAVSSVLRRSVIWRSWSYRVDSQCDLNSQGFSNLWTFSRMHLQVR